MCTQDFRTKWIYHSDRMDHICIPKNVFQYKPKERRPLRQPRRKMERPNKNCNKIFFWKSKREER